MGQGGGFAVMLPTLCANGAIPYHGITKVCIRYFVTKMGGFLQYSSIEF
jgi:hypothetical protein